VISAAAAREGIAQSSMRRSDVIEGVNQVIVDVDDQDRALKFWTETIGFELVQDSSYPGTGRWIEVRTRDKATILVLHVRESERPTAPEDRPTSNIFFYCEDLARAYDELRERGVEFPQPPVHQSWGWWSMFADEEGNRFALGPRESS
jgi:predicted enzyme related to lactoylglutathione lyase